MKLRREIGLWWVNLLRSIPGEIGEACRRKWTGASLGRRVRLLPQVVIYGAKNLSTGSNSAITVGCQLNAKGGIEIGENVLIGPGCFIWSQNHQYSDPSVPICRQGYQYKRVIIEDDVWIAARCVILPGVTIGKGSVVAAGAVVTKSVLPYTVVAGVPAKKIGKRRDIEVDLGDGISHNVSSIPRPESSKP